jgi:hypothetical protein
MKSIERYQLSTVRSSVIIHGNAEKEIDFGYKSMYSSLLFYNGN